ncbi:MAG: hypothetical protein B7733_13080 [Myxococcales bacterium FL481]|nr:MAG: hypothetical protein B7733_13080 [Myxococcales bacterium FL481]
MLTFKGRIVHRTRAQDPDTGGFAAPTETYTEDVPLAIQADSSNEGVRQAAERGVRQYRVFMPYGTSINARDAIDSITGAAEWSGRTLAVKGPPVDHGGRKTYYMVNAEEVGGGAQR